MCDNVTMSTTTNQTQDSVIAEAARSWDSIRVSQVGNAAIISMHTDTEGFVAARGVYSDGTQSDAYVTKDFVGGGIDGHDEKRPNLCVAFGGEMAEIKALAWLRDEVSKGVRATPTLRGESRVVPPSQDRTSINVHPDAVRALRNLLFEEVMRGVGYSEFIMRAVAAAKGETLDTWPKDVSA